LLGERSVMIVTYVYGTAKRQKCHGTHIGRILVAHIQLPVVIQVEGARYSALQCSAKLFASITATRQVTLPHARSNTDSKTKPYLTEHRSHSAHHDNPNNPPTR
jgi:hypothetical protein